MDNRAVAVILIVGVLASMVTFAFYMGFSSPDVTQAPAPAQTSGLLAVEVASGTPAETGTATGEVNNNGQTP